MFSTFPYCRTTLRIHASNTVHNGLRSRLADHQTKSRRNHELLLNYEHEFRGVL